MQELSRLKAGNRRFVEGKTTHDIDSIGSQRVALVARQKPFAVILGCSDSRVPAEIVFDQGLGDLFVIRVAGNVVAPSQIGSVEFAVSMFNTPLVVVMGHSDCGVIHATIEAISNPGQPTSLSIQSIVQRVRPAIEPLLLNCPVAEMKIDDAVRANVRMSVNQLIHSSAMIETKVQKGQLQVIGACYDLSTGKVEFYET